jgi:outer membrane protein assembly factor BamB
MRRIVACLVVILFSSFGSAQTPASSQAASAPGTGSHGASEKPGTAATVPAVQTVVYLRTEVTSNSAKPGKEVKATLSQAVTLPNGEVLPRGTTLAGSVLAVSKHSKDKPNGTLLLEFNSALVKGHDPIPVLVRITKLGPPVAGDGKVTLPNSNGNMVALASNSGGQLLLNANASDHTSTREKYDAVSAIEGVYISPTNQGSGAVFSLGEDVYLEGDIQINVLMTNQPSAPPR